MLDAIRSQTRAVVDALLEAAHLRQGDILVVGCSSSEVLGQKIGSYSSPDTAKVIFDELYAAAQQHGLYLAAQCCEHLNRAIILEEEAAVR